MHEALLFSAQLRLIDVSKDKMRKFVDEASPVHTPVVPFTFRRWVSLSGFFKRGPLCYTQNTQGFPNSLLADCMYGLLQAATLSGRLGVNTSSRVAYDPVAKALCHACTR